MTFLMLLLLFAGIILVAVEAFLPGFGIPGITGLVCIGISATLTIIYFQYGIVIVISEIICLCMAMWALIKWLKTKQIYRGIVLNETLAFEKKDVEANESLVGKEGIVAVALRPFGSVEFNGVKMDAYSEGSFVPKGRTVKVINIENEKIIVRELN